MTITEETTASLGQEAGDIADLHDAILDMVIILILNMTIIIIIIMKIHGWKIQRKKSMWIRAKNSVFLEDWNKSMRCRIASLSVLMK